MITLATKDNRKTGDAGEAVAADFLRQQGYEIVDQNFVYNHGEIDIIAREGTTLVFVEVKTRKNLHFGEPEEAVTPKKQELIRRTAEGYVQKNTIIDVECRFDVVSVIVDGEKTKCKILKNCF